MRRRVLLLLGVGVLLLSMGLVGLAQGGYDLSWWTVDGGGATLSTGEGYRLSGTIGQPDAGMLTSGGYSLGGGFWRGGQVSGRSYEIFLPLVLRGSP